MSDIHVVALGGSLRDGSYTRLGLEHALRGVEEAGGTGELVDLREYDLPMLDADHDEQGDSAKLVEKVRAADAVILGTPMYHGSYSGVVNDPTLLPRRIRASVLGGCRQKPVVSGC